MSISTFPQGTVSVMYQAPEVITLHGTTSIPIESYEEDLGGTSAMAEWNWYGDNASDTGVSREGRMSRQWYGTLENYDLGTGWSNYQDVIENEWWIKATAYSGDTTLVWITGGSSAGDGYGVWRKLSDSSDNGASFRLSLPYAGGKPPRDDSAIIQIDIAATSGGTPVATGYYKLRSKNDGA